MKIDPAHVDQIRRATNGRMVAIDADVGGIAADLKRIDPHLKVRFGENGDPPFWAVYYESDDGRTTYLVLSQRATLTRSGTYSGLDQRVVDRIREIDPQGRGGYNYADELEKQNQLVVQRRRDRFREVAERHGAEAQHALRKDLGVKRHAFIKDKPQTPHNSA
jgi:hypothetical protein